MRAPQGHCRKEYIVNATQLIGRLTKNPELRYTPSQVAVCKFTLAVNRMKKDDGADFIPITVFGKTAEVAEKYLHKGKQVAIEGRIQTGSYEKDGEKRYTTDVIANRVHFISDKTEQKAERSKPDSFQEIEEDIPF